MLCRLPKKCILFVQPDFVDQYVKETVNNTDNYGFTYDYGSIMHYGAARFDHYLVSLRQQNAMFFSASHNKKATMVAFDTKYQESMGSHMLSFIDKSMINEHYKCKGAVRKVFHQFEI